MAEFQHKEGKGSAFANDRKTEDWHADFRGKVMVDGTLRYLDIWKNRDRNGNTYLGVQIGKPVGETRGKPAEPPRDYAKPEPDDAGKPFDDDIPF